MQSEDIPFVIELAPTSSQFVTLISEKGPFLPYNLVILPRNGEAELLPVWVTDIKVGKNSQFYSTSAMPASYFSLFGKTEDLKFDCLPRGLSIALCFQNNSRSRIILEGYVRGGIDVPIDLSDEENRRVALGICYNGPFHEHVIINVQSMSTFIPDQLIIPSFAVQDPKFRIRSFRVRGIEVELAMPKIPGESRGLLKFKAPYMQFNDWITLELEPTAANQPSDFQAVVSGKLWPSTSPEI